MSEIRNLTRNGETFYPLTTSSAVINEATGEGLIIDDEPTAGSDNLVKSGGIVSKYGGTFTKEINAQGSEHSSLTDQIPVKILAGTRMSLKVSAGTAVISNNIIQLWCYDKNGTSVFMSGSLAVGKEYVFVFDSDVYNIGIYFVINTAGTVEFECSYGIGFLSKYSLYKCQQSLNDAEIEQININLKLPLIYTKSASYTNPVAENNIVMTNINLIKGHIYKITADTTNASKASTINIVDSEGNLIAGIAGNVAAGSISEYTYIADNTYINAKLRCYFQGTGNTIVYSIEDITAVVVNYKFDKLFDKLYHFYEKTFVFIGEHSSLNDQVTINAKAGTMIRVQLKAEGTPRVSNIGFYGYASGEVDGTLIGTVSNINTDRYIILEEDVERLGVYFRATDSDSFTLIADCSLDYTINYLVEHDRTNKNSEAFMRLNAAVTKFPHYGSRVETKHISLLVMTDSHSDWPRVTNAFNLGDNTAFDAILHCGDIVEGSGMFSQYNWKDKVLNASKPVIAITGNHEFEYVPNSNVYVGLSDEEVQQKLYDTDLVEHNGDIHPVIGGETKNYFYKDIEKDGFTLRIIGLYQFEWNSPVDGEGHPIYGDGVGKDRVFYTQEQIDWFVNTLKSTPNDYGVIVLSHIPVSAVKYLDNEFVDSEHKGGVYKDLSYLFGFLSNSYFFYSIIDKWKNGGVCTVSSDQITSDGVNHPISVNTTFDGGGIFVANVCGHFHSGGLAHLVNENDEQSTYRVVMSPTTNGTYFQNTGFIGRNLNEDCLNCIVYDSNRDKVNIVRFGAYINNDCEDCKGFSF